MYPKLVTGLEFYMHVDTVSIRILSRLFILKANLSVDICNFTAVIVLKYRGILSDFLYYIVVPLLVFLLLFLENALCNYQLLFGLTQFITLGRDDGKGAA